MQYKRLEIDISANTSRFIAEELGKIAFLIGAGFDQGKGWKLKDVEVSAQNGN